MIFHHSPGRFSGLFLSAMCFLADFELFPNISETLRASSLRFTPQRHPAAGKRVAPFFFLFFSFFLDFCIHLRAGRRLCKRALSIKTDKAPRCLFSPWNLATSLCRVKISCVETSVDRLLCKAGLRCFPFFPFRGGGGRWKNSVSLLRSDCFVYIFLNAL